MTLDPYSCMDTSVIRTMEGRSVTSNHNGSQISGSQQSCLTEMTQRWSFALSNDERRVTGFRFVPDWNHLAWVAGAWKKWAKERTGAREGDTRGVSPLLECPFFLVPTTPKRLLRRLEIVLHRNCHTCQFFRFSSAIFAFVAWSLFVEIQKFCRHNNETKPFDGSTRFVPYVSVRGCRAEWAWERIFEALKAPWEGQKKQPHATHVSFFGWPFPWLFFLFGDTSVSN